MESSTALPASGAASGSATIADLIGRAAKRFADRVAIRHKAEGEWWDVSYAELGETVSEVGRGLIALGVQPGDRVALLCTTRPEWSHVDFGVASAGGVVVPIYPTNSAEECEWAAGDSRSRGLVCEDARQLAKIRAVRERLPDLETLVVIDPAGDTAGAIPLEEVRARGRARDAHELEGRAAAVTRADTFTIIYTSGTTGPPKGCVLSHGNYRDVVTMCRGRDELASDEVIYLFLPLAHSFALLIQLAGFDSGATLAYFGGDPARIVPELSEVRPTYLPSVPRIFEKLYTLVTAQADPASIEGATRVGLAVRGLQAQGKPVPAELQAHFDRAEEHLFGKVRAAFGGNLRQAVTGAAPIAKEILEFFFACGVPVLEGYGLTETATVATASSIEEHRIGSVGRALPGLEIRIAEDGEVLLRGPNVFQGYHGHADTSSFGEVVDGWLHTGDRGRLDGDAYLYITGRKKDIIITAGGKNLTPANVENDLKRSRWISQAMMHGDRRPYPVALVTLDAEEVGPWAQQHGIEDTTPAALAREPRVRALVQEVVDGVNARYAQAEQIKRFAILDHDL